MAKFSSANRTNYLKLKMFIYLSICCFMCLTKSMPMHGFFEKHILFLKKGDPFCLCELSQYKIINCFSLKVLKNYRYYRMYVQVTCTYTIHTRIPYNFINNNQICFYKMCRKVTINIYILILNPESTSKCEILRYVVFLL